MTLFQTLLGLPSYGAMPQSFPADFAHTGQEGYVIEFLPGSSQSWVGNFRRGIGRYDAVFAHPDRHAVIVLAGGRGYIVDPFRRELKGELGGTIEHVWEVSDPSGFVFEDSGLSFLRISTEGTYWHSRRISWDGFRDLVFTPERINGLAWSAIEEKWLPFQVDVTTGQSLGGAYFDGDPEHWEQLAH